MRAIRDGVPDRPINDQNRSSLARKDCDNAVALRHEDDWETRYYHQKNGSIRKRAGDIIQPGDVLGQVGMSTSSNFAHLHLSISKDGHTVDPFVPETATGCSQHVQNGFWRATPTYVPAELFAVGFSVNTPSFGNVKSGTVRLAELATAGAVWLCFFFQNPRQDAFQHHCSKRLCD